MRGFGRGFLIALLLVAVGIVLVVLRPWENANPSSLVSCGNGVFVQPGSACPNGSSDGSATGGGQPQTQPTTVVTIIPAQPTQPQQQASGSSSFVTTANAPCPSVDFSLKQGVATCQYGGGKLLICEGDLDFPSFNFTHDSDSTTGQVFEIDQAGTIDGTVNGGSCHYSPPWTLQQSISSVKHGCGNGCATVLVYKDGQPVS